MNDKQMFKVAFLAKCVEDGLTLDQIHMRVKQALALAEKSGADKSWFDALNPLPFIRDVGYTGAGVAALGGAGSYYLGNRLLGPGLYQATKAPIPTKDDPALAPAGKESYYILYPTPNLDADIDWNVQAKPYRDHMIKTLEDRGYTGLGDSIETEVMTTPLDWQNQGMERGAPFASAHTFFQTGPFRPRNLAAGFENVVFAGSGTQPGVGVPMVLISGRLAAERIVGPVK